MDLFAEENEDAELYSNEIKQNAGFGKEGEKGYEGTITNLQHMMYDELFYVYKYLTDLRGL